MQLSIIIVNYNVKFFLEQCLCSVTKACKNIQAEIFVVDNNSSDGSDIFFRNKFKEVQFIWLDENKGFAKANNIAVNQATGKYILFLNPDTILPEDCLEKTIAFLSKQYNAGATGIRMIDGSASFLKESKRAFPSPLTSLFKLSGLTAVFPTSKIFAKYYLGHLPERQNNEVDVLAGAFMMIKKEVLDKAGSFDEAFFMYGEDVDLSYRIQKAGYKNYYYADSCIIHFKGESTSKQSIKYVNHFYNAMSLFVKKHYGSGKANIYNLLIHSGIAVKKLLALVKRLLPAKQSTNKSLNKNILVIASEKNYAIVHHLIQKNDLPLHITGRVSSNTNISSALATITQLSSLITVHNIQEIIFCEDEDLSFAQIIQQMQQLPKGIHFKFHANNSTSIVGSDNKDTSGNFIT